MPRRLRVAGTLGSIALCGASTAVVLSDVHPVSAPLRPPVAGVATAGTSGAALVIPPAPPCAVAARAPLPSASATARAAAGRLQGAAQGQLAQRTCRPGGVTPPTPAVPVPTLAPSVVASGGATPVVVSAVS